MNTNKRRHSNILRRSEMSGTDSAIRISNGCVVADYDKRVEGGMVSLAEWLRDFKDAKCVYIYDKDDRGPWDEVIKNFENFK